MNQCSCISTRPYRDSPPLRESYRDGNKAKKRTLANLSSLAAEVIEGLKVLLRGGVAVPSAEEAFVIERSLPHGHVSAVLGAARGGALDYWRWCEDSSSCRLCRCTARRTSKENQTVSMRSTT